MHQARNCFVEKVNGLFVDLFKIKVQKRTYSKIEIRVQKMKTNCDQDSHFLFKFKTKFSINLRDIFTQSTLQ